jgi:uncharacterized membrane protein
MANTRKNKGSNKKKSNLLPILTILVVVLATAIVIFVPKGNSNDTNQASNQGQNVESNNNTTDENKVPSGIAATLNDNGDVVINEADITEKASFLEYKSKDDITVGLLVVRASDGTVRTALDTCQVCNGSPYAYFTQVMNGVQCQNCGNIFKLDMIEQERGGCNPIPIMPEDKIVNDSEIIIPAAFLEENADVFENWKKF